MSMNKLVTVSILFLALPAFAQDAAKVLPYVSIQREQAMNAIASCSSQVADLQAKIAELEKQVAEAKQ